MISKEEVLTLLERYESGTCSAREKEMLEKWFADRARTMDWQWEHEEERLLVERLMRARLKTHLFPEKKWDRPVFKRFAIAASILLCCSVAFWLYHSELAPIDPVEQFHVVQAVDPGKNAAILTLADGSTIWLDDREKGVLFDKNGLAIKKLANGELVYEVSSKVDSSESKKTGTNTIRVPRGGQYRLTLPDGTKVWLNSATTLHYPAMFTGKERVVNLSGEAYFEVVKNKQQPFKVRTKKDEILVTGTHFNVTAYVDEDRVVTTLVEGSVQVSHDKHIMSLTPGQQAISSSTGHEIQTRDVDTDYAIAWRHGDFLFEDQDIQTIMKNIARWYDVEVIYQGTPSAKKFGGTYTRSKGLEELLQHLESLGNFRFELNERRITVVM